MWSTPKREVFTYVRMVSSYERSHYIYNVFLSIAETIPQWPETANKGKPGTRFQLTPLSWDYTAIIVCGPHWRSMERVTIWYILTVIYEEHMSVPTGNVERTCLSQKKTLIHRPHERKGKPCTLAWVLLYLKCNTSATALIFRYSFSGVCVNFKVTEIYVWTLPKC